MKKFATDHFGRRLPRAATAWLLTLVMILGLFSGIMVVPVSAAEADEGYVTDGLVLQLDAINNAGTGTHDSTATTWTDLVSGTAIDLNGNTWGEDSLIIDNNYIILPEDVRKAIAGTEFTVEFLIEDLDSTPGSAIKNIMAVTGDDEWIDVTTSAGSTPNDNFVIFMNESDGNNNGKFCFRTCYTNSNGGWTKINSTGNDYAKVTGSELNQVTNTITFTSGGSSVWYVDGVSTSTAANDAKTVGVDGFKVNGTWQTERTPQVIFGAATDTVSSRAFYGEVKAIRVYNRALTAEEAEQNAAADQAHFYPQPSYDADGYLSNGLVLRLDGINNTVDGHSAEAVVWTNLANTTETIALNGNTWGSDSLNINGYIALPESVRQVIASGEFTIEFLMDDFTKATSGCGNIMTLTGSEEWITEQVASGAKVDTQNDNFVIYQNSWEDTVNFKINSVAKPRANVTTDTIDGATQTLTFKTGDYTYWYRNGEQVSVSGNIHPAAPNVADWADTTPQVLFGAATDVVNDRSFFGKVKAIRIYDRVLTEEEIAYNASVDTERFLSAKDFADLAQEAWNAVIENNPAGTTLADLQKHSEDNLGPLGAKHLNVTVTDGGDGKYVFTYTAKTDETFSVSHTLYVDCDYTADFSTMTDDEKAAFLADLLQNPGSAGLTKCDISGDTLHYQGKNYPRPVSSIYLPVYYSGDEYVFEAEIGIPNTIGGNWATMCFGMTDLEHHFQYAFFQKNSGTGAEFCRENGAGKWTGHINTSITSFIGPGEGMIDVNKYLDTTDYVVKPEEIFTYKLIIKDGVAYGFIDGVQVLTAMISGDLDASLNGGFGFNTSGLQLDIKKIRISTDLSNEDVDYIFNPKSSYKVDIYEPDTDIRTAPIVMQTATEETNDVSGETKRPSALIFNIKTVDGVLHAFDGGTDLGTFADLYTANQPKANVGVRIALGDQETANALAAFAEKYSAGNLWVISNDVELLEIVTATANTVRGVVDFTGDTVRGPGSIEYNFDTDSSGEIDDAVGGEYANKTAPIYEYVTYTGGYGAMDWADVYDIVFTLGYRTVLLPESAVNKDHVHFLQGSLVNVIAETTADTEEEFYDLIVSGVNGILSSNYETNIATLESNLFDVDDENILVRGGSIVGHRGDMGNMYVNPENSVESIVSSAQSGASSVEFDVYMTLDGKLILMHNNTIKGYFDYPEGFEEKGILTAEEMAANNAKTITNRYWEGDLEYLVSTYNPEIGMQQLYQLYEAVDTEYPELRLHHEIKDGRIETLNRTIEVMDAYGMRSRSDMMCFTYSVVEYTNSMGISSQYLATPSSYSTTDRIYAAEASYRPVNSTWHTTWANINTEYLEELKHFGQTAYPWPTNSERTMDNYYVLGYQGFTTDIPHWTDDYIKEIVPAIDPVTGEVTATVYTLAHHAEGTFDEGSTTVDDWWIDQNVSGDREYAIADFELVPVAGDPVIDNTNKTAFGDSNDLVAVRYEHQLNGCSYYVYSPSFAPAEPSVISVEVVTGPEKTEYEAGTKELDLTGAQILVTYNTGEAKTLDVTQDMISFDADKIGDQIIYITYGGEQDFFIITVNAPAYSGGSSVMYYNIEVVTNEGGTAAASAKTSAAGKIVTVTVEAEDGYTVHAVTITDSTGNPVPYAVEGSVYTFVMPTNKTIVKVTFAETCSDDCPSAKFTDVSAGDWFHAAVDCMVEKGIMTGVSSSIFAPGATTTRGMIVTMLYNLEGKPAISDNTFEDVTAGEWYANAVNWAAEKGIVSGYGNNKFGPNDNVTREQMAAILYRYAQYKGYDVSVGEDTNILSYTDGFDVSEYAYPALQWACGAGIISGKGNDTLDPSGEATRAEVAQMMKQFVELY